MADWVPCRRAETGRSLTTQIFDWVRPPDLGRLRHLPIGNSLQPVKNLRLLRTVLWMSVAWASLASAQTFETLFAFPKLGSVPDEPMIRGSDGNFYGTSDTGGSGGSSSGGGHVFKLTPAGVATVLHAFDVPGTVADGARPTAGLVEVGAGVFYGLTREGGTSNYGTAFKITRTGVFTHLYDFTLATGRYPNRGLALAGDGNLYGVTSQGGTNNRGTIFRLTPDGVHTVLYHFGATGPGLPYARLVRGPDGALYGTETNGRTVFRITTAGVFSTLATLTLNQGTGLFNPLAVGADGNFYGAAAQGGSNGDGTLFRVTPAGVVTLLRAFNGTNGANPSAGLLLAPDGNFYGTTHDGGTDNGGTLFRMTPGGAVTVLRSFSSITAGAGSGLVLHNGLLYGIGEAIFTLSTGGIYTEIARYDGTNRGMYPKAGLLEASDGNFYGGTATDSGVIYKLTPAGEQSVVVRFNVTNGQNVQGALIQGRDGHLYGVTSRGGAHSRGTVFRLTLPGVHTVLHSFADTGSVSANGGLVEGDDGNFYGALSQNGSATTGTIYRISPQGAFSVVHDFSVALGPEGGGPVGPLLKVPGGNFIAATAFGAANDAGTVFRLTPQGALTVLASITKSAYRIQGGFILGADGSYYAAAQLGSIGDQGALVKCTPAGVLSILTAFSRENGEAPLAAPVLGRDGNFYGTTSDGSSFPGVLYRVTPAGVETVLKTLAAAIGTAPQAPLILGRDGALYGVTSVDGPGGGGTIFRLIVAPTATTEAASAVRAATATLSGSVLPNGSETEVWFEYSTDATFASGVIATAIVSVGRGSVPVPVTAALSGLTPGTLYHARVSARNPNGTAVGGSVSFTTNTPPTGGTNYYTHTPFPTPVPGTMGRIGSVFWTDPDLPLTYQFFLDGVALGPRSTAFAVDFVVPAIGAHTLTWRIFDSVGDFAETNLAFIVNNSPTTRPVSLGAVADGAVTVSVAKLLLFSADPDGHTLSITGVVGSSARGGLVTFLGDRITYSPPAGYSGPDSFSYMVRDVLGATVMGTVNVNVTAAAIGSLNLISMTQTPAGFLLKYAGIPGYAYVIQFRASMNDPWQTLVPPGPIAAGPTGLIEFEDRPSPRPPARFYRAAAP